MFHIDAHAHIDAHVKYHVIYYGVVITCHEIFVLTNRLCESFYVTGVNIFQSWS